ncbi:MAG TPA: hypothetical protein VKT29_14855, partial [Terriglobales bacterium]|nr:hypothetical protein [Terriglobales bacterium]
MKRALMIATTLLLAVISAHAGSPTITYIPGTSHKLYQINGDCDWVEWDADLTNPVCNPTISQTATNGD